MFELLTPPQNLEILTKRYLEPMKTESVLPLSDVSLNIAASKGTWFTLNYCFVQINTLVGNIPDILSTQRTFLRRLEVNKTNRTSLVMKLY
jgi:hypothetical protein